MIKFYEELNKKNSIQIYAPFSDLKEEYIIPNAYYINTDGILYNSFGLDGHKEANLVYTYDLIKDALYLKKYISFDFKAVSLESVLKEELVNYKRIISGQITRYDVKNYIHMNVCDLSDPLVIKCIIGIVSSKIILLEKFIELKNKSINVKENIEKIISESNDDITDILVRYCGFHKVESQVDNMITTSSLNLYSFKNYLDRGFNLCVIPEISLDDGNDLFYKKLVLDKFIDKNPQYDGKILMR